MSSYKSVIEKAKLLAMSPEGVAAFMAKASEQNKDKNWLNGFDEELEAALRARHEPLIDLALCTYGHHKDVLRPMFEASDAEGPLRLAVLCNRELGTNWGDTLPAVMFSSDAAAADWLATASRLELAALFQNPTLKDGFLRNLLEGSDPWGRIPNEQLGWIVAILASNERMGRSYETNYLNGWDDCSYHSVFRAAWKLSERMPTTAHWAQALGRLFETLRPVADSLDAPLVTARRWYPTQIEGDKDISEGIDLKFGVLSRYQTIRKGLAKLAVVSKPKLLSTLLESEDPAFRAAAYAHAELTSEQFDVAHKKDGGFMVHHSVENPCSWKSHARREALSEAAWATKGDDMLAVNLFNGAKRKLLNDHPEWFLDDDFAREAFDRKTSPTRSDITNLKTELEKLPSHSDLENISHALRNLEKKVVWLLWIAIGVAIGVFLKSL